MSDLDEQLSKIADEFLMPASVEYNTVIRASVHIRSAEAHIVELEAARDEAREACEKWKSALELQIEKCSPSTTDDPACPHCGHVTCGCYPDTEGRI